MIRAPDCQTSDFGWLGVIKVIIFLTIALDIVQSRTDIHGYKSKLDRGYRYQLNNSVSPTDKFLIPPTTVPFETFRNYRVDLKSVEHPENNIDWAIDDHQYDAN